MFIKIFKLILISFFLISPANSNSIYNLIKIPNLEIYELKTPNKLKYFYATKPWTDKFSTTYSASVAIDSATSDHMLDVYSQTVNLSYSIGNGISLYMLNDINPHFQRTETWTGITYAW